MAGIRPPLGILSLSVRVGVHVFPELNELILFLTGPFNSWVRACSPS